ncbi:MAG TPA: hypothetical protein PLB32_15145 [Acidobacteriota bacterium]|nr:hypothetical protein [Acidobacteriota bacterium]
MAQQIESIRSKVVIEANLFACFSEVRITVDITFHSDQLPWVVATQNRETIFDGQLPSERVTVFLNEVFQAATKPERVTGERITTHYEATLNWHNYPIPKLEASGQLHFKGHDLPEELLRENLHRLKGETAQRIKELLEVGLHCRPMVIFSIAHAFLENLRDKSQSAD